MHALKSLSNGQRRLLGTGLLTALLWCPAAWSQMPGGQPPMINGGGQPQPGAPGLPGGTGAATNTIAIQMGDAVPIRHFSNKPIKQIISSREGIVEIKPYVQDNRQLANLYIARGVAIGITTITVEVEGEQPDVFAIRVDANLEYIRNLVATQFPTANVKITAGPTQNTYIVTGWVDSPEQVDPLRNFILGFVPQAAGGVAREQAVTMAVQVAGVQQVQLEVCVAKVVRGDVRALGFSFGHSDSQNFFGNAFLPLATLGQGGTLSPGTAPAISATFGAASGGALGNIQFGLTSDSSAFLGALQALRQESLAKILATPTIVTMSGRQAQFVVGGETPAIAAGVGGGGGNGGGGNGGGGGGGGNGGGGGGGGAIQFRSFGTIVRFLPVVLGGGRIRIQVQAEVSRPSGVVVQPTYVAPSFEVTTVQSTVEMENNQTLVIGGLLQNEANASTTKVPVLGDLPFIGSAFRLVSYDEEETELIILVTPKLVEAMDSSQRPCRLPGHETRRPTDFELFLEGILEAPRGPRDPFPNRRYVPAYKNAEPFSTAVGEGCDNGACNPCGPTSGIFHKAKTSSCGTCSTPMTTGTPVVVQPVPQPQPVMAQPQPMSAASVAAPPAPAAPVVRTSAATMPAPVMAPAAAPAPTPSVAPASAPVMPKSSRALIVPSTPTPKEVEPTVPPLPPGSEAPKSDIPELPKSEQP